MESLIYNIEVCKMSYINRYSDFFYFLLVDNGSDITRIRNLDGLECVSKYWNGNWKVFSGDQ